MREVAAATTLLRPRGRHRRNRELRSARRLSLELPPVPSELRCRLWQRASCLAAYVKLPQLSADYVNAPTRGCRRRAAAALASGNPWLEPLLTLDLVAVNGTRLRAVAAAGHAPSAPGRYRRYPEPCSLRRQLFTRLGQREPLQRPELSLYIGCRQWHAPAFSCHLWEAASLASVNPWIAALLTLDPSCRLWQRASAPTPSTT